jgi:hypothetical protein
MVKVRKRLVPVILYESWSEDPEDEGHLCERIFSVAPFGAIGTVWATVYDLVVKESFAGLFTEDMGNVFYVRACSPGFEESDDRFRGKWRVESDSFDDEEIKRAITEHIESIRGIPLIKDPVEVLAASVYCEER